MATVRGDKKKASAAKATKSLRIKKEAADKVKGGMPGRTD